MIGAGLSLAILFNLVGAVSGLSVVLGSQSLESYLGLNPQPGLYAALQFLNRSTPPDAKIISYGEPRLFYLDRPYLWGEPNYHRLLDYDRIKTADDLLVAYRNLGLSHVLINRQFFPGGTPANERIAALLQEALAVGRLRKLPASSDLGPYEVLAIRPPGVPAGPAS